MAIYVEANSETLVSMVRKKVCALAEWDPLAQGRVWGVVVHVFECCLAKQHGTFEIESKE